MYLRPAKKSNGKNGKNYLRQEQSGFLSQPLDLLFSVFQYRAPFMSFMALLWTVYISVKRAR